MAILFITLPVIVVDLGCNPFCAKRENGAAARSKMKMNFFIFIIVLNFNDG